MEGMEMNYTTTEPLDYISELMADGHWTEAQRHFKAVNCSARDFMYYIDEQSEEEKSDWALLGFYCRDYQPQEEFKYE